MLIINLDVRVKVGEGERVQVGFGWIEAARGPAGDTIWVEEKGTDGKPNVYYKYDTNRRLMKHSRTLFGYNVTRAEYERFGEKVKQ